MSTFNRERSGEQSRRKLFRELGVSTHFKDRRGDMTARYQDGAKMNIHSEGVSETIEDHIIPRKSQGNKQGLMLFPQYPVEGIEIKSFQMDQSFKETHTETIQEPYKESPNGPILFRPIQVIRQGRKVSTSDIKVTRMSEKTLLTTSKQFGSIEDARIKRRTSISKVIRQDQYPVLLSGKSILDTTRHAREDRDKVKK